MKKNLVSLVNKVRSRKIYPSWYTGTEETEWISGADNVTTAGRIKEFASGRINDDIYVILGICNNQSVNTNFSYNALSNSWTQHSVAPGKKKEDLRTNAVHYSDIYIPGGYIGGNYINDNLMYNAVTDTYVFKTPMTQRTGYSQADVVNHKMYVYGGYTDKDTPITEGNVLVYDTVTDVWADSGAIGGYHRIGMQSVVVKDKIYYSAGILGGNISATKHQVFDTVTKTFTELADCKTQVSNTQGCYLNGEIWMIGGGGASNNTSWRYNISNNTWVEDTGSKNSAVIDNVTYSGSCAVIRGHIYVIVDSTVKVGIVKD